MIIMIININSKKMIEGEKPIFDLQGQTPITLKTDQEFQSLSSSLYLAGSRVYNDSTKILFLSNTFTINEDEITFIVDTYTENYLKYINEFKTPFNLEFGAFSGSKTIFLLDKAFANPRVYVEGMPPAPVDEYYTKTEADAKFLSILSANQLYYTKEESDERYLSGNLNDYLKLNDPQPISGNLVVNGNTSTETLTINGSPFDPSDYLPLSGGNVDFLSISGIPVDPRGADLSGYMHLSGDIIDGSFELSGYGGVQHTLRSIFKLNEAGNISIGPYANANESVIGTISIGTSTAASGQYSTALGYNAYVNSEYSTAVGYKATIYPSSHFSLALGAQANAKGNYSTALGAFAETKYDYQIAIGETDTDKSYLTSAAIIFSHAGDNGGYMDNNLNWHFLQNVEVNGNLSATTLTISGNPFNPTDYATYNDLSSYLPLSGGDVDALTINNVRAATSQDLEDYMPISGGTFEGEVSLPSAIVSSLIQNGVDYQLSGLAQDYVLSSFTSTTLTPQSNIFYHSASALASLTLTIPTGVRNTFIFFETGSTFSATITLDSLLFVNEEIEFEANKAYLIAIERDCVLWTEMIQ